MGFLALNQVQVPLISPHLRRQLFPPVGSPFAPPPPTEQAIAISRQHLQAHGLLAPPATHPSSATPSPSPAAAISFDLPALQGPTIAHHFNTVGHHTAEPYLTLAREFVTFAPPAKPDPASYILRAGWTMYHTDGSWEAVEYPGAGVGREESALVFDVETLPWVGGDFPVLGVALGRHGWYAWCSPWLTGASEVPNHLIPLSREDLASSSPAASPSTRPVTAPGLPLPPHTDLFESPTTDPLLVIGHHVLFDRARCSTEYTLRRPRTRWLDTQSLHVATAGLTNPQRIPWMSYRKQLAAAAAENATDAGSVRPLVKSRQAVLAPAPAQSKRWEQVSSTNSLLEVAKLHCGISLDKTLRNVFIDPSVGIADVRQEFSTLLDYCAEDVRVTKLVYNAVLPLFLQQCPHPASFAGIMIMSQPVLPVDHFWPRYLERSQRVYAERVNAVKTSLVALAEEAKKLTGVRDSQGRWAWEDDLWLRQLDWSPRKARRVGPSPNLAASDTSSSVMLPLWYANFTKSPLTPAQFISRTAIALWRTTWRSYPTYYSTTTKAWLFAVPSAEAPTLSLDPHEDLVDPTDLGADPQLQALSGIRLYTVPPATARAQRCLRLLQPKRVTSGLVASLHPELAEGVALLSEGRQAGPEFQHVLDKLKLLAEVALGAGTPGNDPWLQQLDWTPISVTLSPSNSPAISTSAVPLPQQEQQQQLVWPQWYYDLDIVRSGLDISTSRRAAPILLKLQWKGYPVAKSAQYGWTFRIPVSEAPSVLAADLSLRPLTFSDVADTSMQEDAAVYVRLPHPDGEGKNVGSPLSKSFVDAFETGVLSSEYPAAAAALAMNASCSYWTSSQERILQQMVVWQGNAQIPPPTPAAIADPTSTASTTTQGLILPQVIPMGTVTRRSVEKTWLTASNAKKNRVGSELKSMIRAPPGYAIVGADVDSEELWICSVMGDAQFGVPGATAVGWMTLEGTKATGTDLHSKSASILGISRDDAKVFNYSRIYGAGVKHAVQLLVKSNPSLTRDEATRLAKNLYAGTKGVVSRTGAFGRQFWHGGTESFVFNKLEEIAARSQPTTPALGCGITNALTKEYLPATGRDTFLPSRINWVVQSSGVDYLHLLLVSMEYLCRRFDIDARYMISVHDEVRYLVKQEDKYRAALALQISNLWTRALFSYRLQMGDLPQVSVLLVNFLHSPADLLAALHASLVHFFPPSTLITAFAKKFT